MIDSRTHTLKHIQAHPPSKSNVKVVQLKKLKKETLPIVFLKYIVCSCQIFFFCFILLSRTWVVFNKKDNFDWNTN